MAEHTIELDDLSDHVTLTEDADSSEWPAARIDLTVRWNPAERDVGIMSDWPEITRVVCVLDGEAFKDQAEFVAALYQRIGDDIEESQDALAELIENRIENEELGND